MEEEVIIQCSTCNYEKVATKDSMDVVIPEDSSLLIIIKGIKDKFVCKKCGARNPTMFWSQNFQAFVCSNFLVRVQLIYKEYAWLTTNEMEVLERITQQIQLEKKVLTEHVRIVKLLERNIEEKKRPTIYQGGSPS